MSQYIPRPNSLKIVEHSNWKGSSGTVYMIHDDHGEFDGPYASRLDAMRTIDFRDNWEPHFPS